MPKKPSGRQQRAITHPGSIAAVTPYKPSGKGPGTPTPSSSEIASIQRDAVQPNPVAVLQRPLGAKLSFTCVLQPEELSTGEPGYVSLCPEIHVASQGDTAEEARANLKEAIEGLIEVFGLAEIERRLRENAELISTVEVAIAVHEVPVA